jgi:hypothetical protein
MKVTSHRLDASRKERTGGKTASGAKTLTRGHEQFFTASRGHGSGSDVRFLHFYCAIDEEFR